MLFGRPDAASTGIARRREDVRDAQVRDLIGHPAPDEPPLLRSGWGSCGRGDALPVRMEVLFKMAFTPRHRSRSDVDGDRRAMSRLPAPGRRARRRLESPPTPSRRSCSRVARRPPGPEVSVEQAGGPAGPWCRRSPCPPAIRLQRRAIVGILESRPRPRFGPPGVHRSTIVAGGAQGPAVATGVSRGVAEARTCRSCTRSNWGFVVGWMAQASCPLSPAGALPSEPSGASAAPSLDVAPTL